jgi:DNA replication and repair protein RecF
MLLLQKISLCQFKNYPQKNFIFNENIIAVAGANGTGKTNLLDAIYFLCFTKSYFSRDAQAVQHDRQGLRIDGNFLKSNTPQTLTAIIRENNKKEFLVNDEEYKKLSEHIGKFPCVMIAPDDISLINNNSDERRKFMDTILSQINTSYLQNLIAYNKILLQRNSLLKQANEQHFMDDILFETLNEQLIERGEYIFNERKKFLAALFPLVQEVYNEIAQKDDNIHIAYESYLLNASFKQLLKENKQRDIAAQRTTSGIHKDDIYFSMNNDPFKTLASQGQKKSLLFALKLAEFSILKRNKGFSPILLLDDIFEKLDNERMHQLLNKVCVQEQAQVFITDTHQNRLEESLSKFSVSFQIINL